MKKKTIFLATILLLYLFSLLFIFSPQVKIVGNAVIDGLATFGSASLSLSVVNQAAEVKVPSSGNVTFNDTAVNQRITTISGLQEGQHANITLFGVQFPSSWTESEPNSSQAGSAKIEYFEVVMNYTTSGGSYTIFFNLTQAELGSLPAANISLFVFETNWTNLSTTVIDGSSNPAQFYAVITHFSKFLIAQKPATGGGGTESGGGTGGAAAGGGGGGGGSSSGKKVIKPTEPSKEVLKEITEKLPEPVHKPGILFDVNVNIPEAYRKVLPGEEVVAEIHAINIKSIGEVTVTVEYAIEDREGNIFFKEVETKVVENEVKYLKHIALPADFPLGTYMFFARVKYGEDIALAGYPFEVIEEKKALFGLAVPLLTYRQLFKDYGIYLLGFVIVITSLLLIIHFIKRKRIPKLEFIRRN